MKRFIKEDVRTQSTLLPDTLYDYVAEDNPVRAVDAFVGHLNLLAGQAITPPSPQPC